MTQIKAIIFDMDGVLIDAREWHYEALNQALDYFGFSISRHDHVRTFDGLPTRTKLEMLSLERGFPTHLHDIVSELKQKLTMNYVYQNCFPKFDQEYALARLKRDDGYRLAVASNSIKNSITEMLGRAGLLEYIEFFLSAEDVSEGKPSPEIYLLAIDTLGIAPEQCLIIEDSESGKIAARGSGAWVMEVDAPDEVNYLNIRERISRIEEMS